MNSRTGKRFLLIAWAAVTVWLLWSGQYQIFVRPEFSFLLLLQLGILLILLASTFFERGLSCSRHGRSSWPTLAVVLLPLLYWAAVRNASLGSHALENRSIQAGVLGSFKPMDTLAHIKKTGELTPLQVLQYFKEFQGKKITTTGMVHADEAFPEQHVLVYRFVLFCCAADALPAAALVSHKDIDTFENDTWVKVTGTLNLKQAAGFVFPHIEADEITAVDQPALPYIFSGLF
jgi:putative membrane protein